MALLGALSQCRHIPSWEKPFLEAVLHGYNEKNAANRAGIGTTMIQMRMENDPIFKQEYEDAVKNQKNQPKGGF